MPLKATEIWLDYTIEDGVNHIAICHGCGFRVQYEEFAGVYIGHSVNTCLLFLRPKETRPEWCDRWLPE